MSNERLRDAMMAAGVTTDVAADQLGLDPQVRRAVADHPAGAARPQPAGDRGDGAPARVLPLALGGPPPRQAQIAQSEIVAAFPHRGSVPSDLWDKLIDDAHDRIDILVHAGQFLAERPGFVRTLAEEGRRRRHRAHQLRQPRRRCHRAPQRGGRARRGRARGAHPLRPRALPAAARDARCRVPVPRDHAVQLDLPLRRRDDRQHRTSTACRARTRRHCTCASSAPATCSTPTRVASSTCGHSRAQLSGRRGPHRPLPRPRGANAEQHRHRRQHLRARRRRPAADDPAHRQRPLRPARRATSSARP